MAHWCFSDGTRLYSHARVEGETPLAQHLRREENSMGFHAPQESARILAEAIDLARQGQLEVLRIK